MFVRRRHVGPHHRRPDGRDERHDAHLHRSPVRARASARFDGGEPAGVHGVVRPTAELAEGRHTFAVRAAGVPVSEIRRFEVDTTAPDRRAGGRQPGRRRRSRPRGRTSSSTPAAGDDEGTLRVQDHAGDRARRRRRVRAVRGGSPAGGPRRRRAHHRHPRPGRRRQPGGVRRRVAGLDGRDVHRGTPAPGADVAAAPNGPLTAPDSVVRLADGLHISTGASAGSRREHLGRRPQRRPVPRVEADVRRRRPHRAPADPRRGRSEHLPGRPAARGA